MVRRNIGIGALLMLMCVVLGGADAAAATTVTLVADRGAPQPLGTVIRWTAAASGGTAPYSFKWWLYNGSTWQVLRDWSASPSFDWAPAAANSAYRVGVWVRSSGNAADVDEANEGMYFAITPSNQRVSAVSLTADRAAPQPAGTTVVWTAHPAGGVAPHSFKWWLFDGAAWRPLGDWTTAATWAWTPHEANSAYRVGVWVRSAGNASEVDEANQGANFSITPASAPPRASAVTLTADPGAPQLAGTQITWTATASGGTAPHSFKWWLYDGASWTLLRDWGTSPSLVWTPASPNAQYRIGVWVRSSTNTSNVDEVNLSQPFQVSSQDRVTAVSLAADRTAPQPAGTSVRWTATPLGGVAPISYKWWLFDGERWEALGNWSTSPVLAWTPAQASDRFRIGVWARSATNTTEVDEANISQPFTITAASSSCVMALEPRLASVGSGGGSLSTQVSGSGGACQWDVSSRASWISLSSPARASGDGAVTVTVEANLEAVSRTGTVTIGGQSLSITQGGASTPAGCSYAVFPASLDVGFENGSAQIAVTAPSGCAWSASGSGFVRAATGSGVGSATVQLTIENNTAVDARATVLTVAGRAITVTQAGRAATPPGCTFEVSPTGLSVNFHASDGAVTVTAPPGCAWTASSGSAFIHLTGPASAEGTRTVGFVVDANGDSSARSGVLMIAGRAVTIAQGAAAAVPACVYSLSVASTQVSHAGGSGTVSVSTTDGCGWDATSRTDWLGVTESTGSHGSGVLWFRVDHNDGSERAGTLVVAGQTFTVIQAGPPVSASASDISWAIPPDAGQVGDCSGNCGAGCGTFFNPCGGPHYWEHTVLTSPQYVGDDWEEVCTGSSSWFVVRPRYTALARWTYHGLKSSNCEAHDATCRALGFLPLPADLAVCLATAGLVGLNGLNYCRDARPFQWSYEFIDVGHGAPVAYHDAPGACQ